MMACVSDDNPAVVKLLSAVRIGQVNGSFAANDSVNVTRPIDFENHILWRVGDQEMAVRQFSHVVRILKPFQTFPLNFGELIEDLAVSPDLDNTAAASISN